MVDAEVDPTTFQIINHRLSRVTDEAMTSLKRVSGSTATNEANDLLVALYTQDGDLLAAGSGFLHHIIGAAKATQHIIERFQGDINEGDAFLLNDPFVAALHPPDMYVIRPIFFRDELCAFSACFVHVSDIGAIDAGGFCPNSTSNFHEGFQTPGLKLVDEHEIRRDVLETILNMSRDPDLVELDIRSLIVANNVAEDRLRTILAEYGRDAIDSVGNTLIERSEKRLRNRLAELPTGEWQARQYLDSPAEDRLFRLELTLRNEGDSLVFDFQGTSEQSTRALNCTRPATLGAVTAPLLALLCHDMTWNAGVLAPIDVDIPEGTILNARKPAPVANATVTSIQLANKLATIPISKMLASHPELAENATAVWRGTHCATELEVKRGAESTVQMLTDTFAGGGGGRAHDDGIDLGGELANTVSRWGNVERHERDLPLVYLYRRFREDSGGPGKYRGGVGHEFAVTPLPETDAEIELTTFGRGVTVPHGQGVFGGYPSPPVDYAILGGTDIWSDRSLESVFPYLPDGIERGKAEAATVLSAEWGVHSLEPGDIYSVKTGGGGGGYGDPLQRDIGRVATDVGTGLVSRDHAQRIYGVPVVDGEVDPDETTDIRKKRRQERVAEDEGTETPVPNEDVEPTGIHLGESVTVVSAEERRFAACRHCDTVLAPLEENWKDRAVVLATPFDEIADIYSGTRDDLRFREFICFECGSLLESEVCLEGDPLLRDSLAEGQF